MCQTYDEARKWYDDNTVSYTYQDYKTIFEEATYEYDVFIDGTSGFKISPNITQYFDQNAFVDNASAFLHKVRWLKKLDNKGYDHCDPRTSDMNLCDIWYIYHNILKKILSRYVDMRQAAQTGLDMDEKWEVSMTNFVSAIYWSSQETCLDDKVEFIQQDEVESSKSWHCWNPLTSQFILSNIKHSKRTIDRLDKWIIKPREFFVQDCITPQDTMHACSFDAVRNTFLYSDSLAWKNLIENERFWSDHFLTYMNRAIQVFPNIADNQINASLSSLQENVIDRQILGSSIVQEKMRSAMHTTNMYLENFSLAYIQYITLNIEFENLDWFIKKFGGNFYTSIDQMRTLFKNVQEE